MTETLTAAEQAFYAWFQASGRHGSQLESLREAFLAGWDAEIRRNTEA